MGGNIFKDCKRINREEYARISEAVSKKLALLERKILIPDSFKEKVDHGDLDVIVEGAAVDSQTLAALFDLPLESVSRNNTVVSIFFEGQYQVDLAFHSGENFLSAYQYQRNSDCGNIVGRIAHSLGFTFGHSGLVYKVNLSDCEKVGEVFISNDIEEILAFFDLEFAAWEEGFNNQEELFAWVAKSKYFNPESFKFENLNHVNRVRNRKRPVFAALVDWLEGKEFNGFKVKNKAEHLWAAMLHFDCISAVGEIESMLILYRQTQQANKCFNGDLVMSWVPGLKGKDLGAAMAGFRASIGRSSALDWMYWRLVTEEEEIKRLFLEWYEKHN